MQYPDWFTKKIRSIAAQCLWKVPISNPSVLITGITAGPLPEKSGNGDKFPLRISCFITQERSSSLPYCSLWDKQSRFIKTHYLWRVRISNPSVLETRIMAGSFPDKSDDGDKSSLKLHIFFGKERSYLCNIGVYSIRKADLFRHAIEEEWKLRWRSP